MSLIGRLVFDWLIASYGRMLGVCLVAKFDWLIGVWLGPSCLIGCLLFYWSLSLVGHNVFKCSLSLIVRLVFDSGAKFDWSLGVSLAT